MLTIFSSIISGILGVLISTWYYRRYEKRKRKLEVLRKILGGRFYLTKPSTNFEESEYFFTALNEVFIIFNDSDEVVNALSKMLEQINDNRRMLDNLLSLIKAMCNDLDIDYTQVNDSFFERPFTPGNIE